MEQDELSFSSTSSDTSCSYQEQNQNKTLQKNSSKINCQKSSCKNEQKRKVINNANSGKSNTYGMNSRKRISNRKNSPIRQEQESIRTECVEKSTKQRKRVVKEKSKALQDISNEGKSITKKKEISNKQINSAEGKLKVKNKSSKVKIKA